MTRHIPEEFSTRLIDSESLRDHWQHDAALPFAVFPKSTGIETDRGALPAFPFLLSFIAMPSMVSAGAAIYGWLPPSNLLLYVAPMEAKRASAELEAFIDEGIKLSIERGYHPTIFVGMRHARGTIDAIERLVQSPDIQTGFNRLRQLNLLDWTIEAAIMRFPSEFSNDARQCAEWRLQQVQPR